MDKKITRKQKVCILCNNTFKPKSNNSKICPSCKSSKCLNCNTILLDGGKYCSNKCQAEYQWKQTVENILKAGEFDHNHLNETNRTQARKFLIQLHGHKCSICNLSEWMNKPIPLIVDHIDGNPTNHSIENFRLVCGNCDMQLDTYKNKNKGNGRKYRRDLYKKEFNN
jgi:hypothetical protein